MYSIRLKHFLLLVNKLQHLFYVLKIVSKAIIKQLSFNKLASIQVFNIVNSINL